MSDLPVKGRQATASMVPFGLSSQKPRHFREMAEVVWENRDSLPYAWRILDKGVCDGCSLGPRGLRDDVIEGVHLCTTRLKLLRLNTMPAFHPGAVADVAKLKKMGNRALQAMGRVPCPLVWRKGERGFKPLLWNDALRLAGGALRETPGARQAWFATSRGLTNEAYYAFTKAARLAGTNNVDLCARLCHQASVAGLKATIGVGAPTCSLKDMIGTDLLLLWGTDIANNQPVTMKYLAEAKARGTRIVVINPLREKGLDAYWVPSMPMSALFGTVLMDDFIPVAVGGDIALADGILKALVERGAIDRPWIDAHTRGWVETESMVRDLAWAEIESHSGVPRAQIEWVAELMARARSAVTVWSMGITQHHFGTDNVRAITNLHLARGFLGRDKCGVIPIRGHSGVQGGGECGVGPTILPGGVPNDATHRARFAQHWGHPLPDAPGLSIMPMVEAMLKQRIDFLYNVGGNLLAVLPDPASVQLAFDRVRFRVHQDIVFNTSTVLDGAETVLVLPAQTRYEQRGGGTSTSTERRIRFSPEIPGHPTVGESRPEYEIPAQVVLSAFPKFAAALSWNDAADIRVEMESTMPLYKGIAGLKAAGDHVQWGGEILCRDGNFPGMPDGKARFSVVPPRRVDMPEGAYYLTTRRGKQFNSMVFKDHDPVQGGKRRDDVLVSAHDLAILGLASGSAAVLVSDTGRFPCTLREDLIRPGVLQAYWPECNVLISRRIDPVSEEPDYNAVVRVERV